MGTLVDRDILFPAEPQVRSLARALYETVAGLPIISPHGHTDPRWYALNEPFPDPAQLLIVPDHYIFRMLFSQGIALEELGVPRLDAGSVERDGRRIPRLFAENYHLFRGTPTRLWMDYVLSSLFRIDAPLGAATADSSYDRIAERLARPEYRPRALFERFNIEAIATTDGALDDLSWHGTIRDSGWKGRVVPAYRPDAVVDPDFEGFAANLDRFGELTGEDTGTWRGYLEAHRKRRAFFKSFGATSSDHGHPSAETANLSAAEAAALFDRLRAGHADAAECGLFRAQMLTEMAKMSLDDGLVLQIHPGSWRNHSPTVMERFGRDKGFDIPTRTDYVGALKPLLDAVGLERDLTIVLFTLDESAYSRELAPLAGVYPALRLGPAWWFYDSPEGMRRFRELTTETAGFYNTVGFNDDTRAFPSIPARHDIARRVDCAFLARLVSEHRLRQDEAFELATELAYTLAKKGVSALMGITPEQTGRKTMLRLLNCAAATVVAACLMSGPAGAQTVLRSSDTHPDGYPTVEAVKYFGELIAQRTDGRYTVEVYHSAQLGQEADTIEQVRSGVIDLNRVSMAPWNSLVPVTLIPSLPYLFRSAEHARAVMSGPIGDEVAAGFEEHGVVVLTYYDGGARSFYNSVKPINSMADLADLKFRVIQSDVFVDMVAALGASATPMPYGEVYSSIETGVIDGAENNFPSYESAKHFEVAKYYSLDEHTIVPEVFVMSKVAWDKLTPEDQEIFRQAARESMERQWELWDARVEQSRGIVEEAGSEITNPEKQPFIDAMKPVYDKYVNTPELQDLVARIQATEG